jgi:NADPH2:quinone reductase
VSDSRMRAAVTEQFGPPQSLRVAELPLPEPQQDEVSIDVDYAGVGFVDTLLRAGAFPLSTPMVPGIEVTGRIRAVGPGVRQFVVGQRVAALLNDFGRCDRAGGYAEVAVAHHTMASAVPEGVDLARVAAVISNGVAAWMALREVARLSPRDRVLVLGASGGLGATTARIAALQPAAQVIGVVGHDPDRAPRECTDVIVADELDEQLDRLAPDGKVDVVIDPVGGPQRVTAYEHLAPFGRLVVLGDASGDDRHLSADDAWLGTRVIAGLSVGGIAHLRPVAIADALAAIINLVARGVLNEPPPALEPLQNAAAVHTALESRTAPAKTVLSLR